MRRPTLIYCHGEPRRVVWERDGATGQIVGACACCGTSLPWLVYDDPLAVRKQAA